MRFMNANQSIVDFLLCCRTGSSIIIGYLLEKKSDGDDVSSSVSGNGRVHNEPFWYSVGLYSSVK
jgi:hypothetical protein